MFVYIGNDAHYYGLNCACRVCVLVMIIMICIRKDVYCCGLSCVYRIYCVIGMLRVERGGIGAGRGEGGKC